jgi:hypothetical protein
LTQWYFCIFCSCSNFCLGPPRSSALAALPARTTVPRPSAQTSRRTGRKRFPQVGIAAALQLFLLLPQSDEALLLIVLMTRAPYTSTCVRALHFQSNKPQFIIHLVRVLRYHFISIRRSPIWGHPYPGRSQMAAAAGFTKRTAT